MIMFLCVIGIVLCVLGILLCRALWVTGQCISKIENIIFNQGGEITRTRDGFKSLTRSLENFNHALNLQMDTITHLIEEHETHSTQLDWIDERFNSLEHIMRDMEIESSDLVDLANLLIYGETPMMKHYKRFHNCKPSDSSTGTDPNEYKGGGVEGTMPQHSVADFNSKYPPHME